MQVSAPQISWGGGSIINVTERLEKEQKLMLRRSEFTQRYPDRAEGTDDAMLQP